MTEDRTGSSIGSTLPGGGRDYGGSGVDRGYGDEQDGFSVRCVGD